MTETAETPTNGGAAPPPDAAETPVSNPKDREIEWLRARIVQLEETLKGLIPVEELIAPAVGATRFELLGYIATLQDRLAGFCSRCGLKPLLNCKDGIVALDRGSYRICENRKDL